MSTSRQLMRGAAWMVSLRWSVRLLGVVTTVVVARLLAPEDFGVFAIGLITLAFLEFLGEGGIEFALIRERNATRAHFDSAWTMQIILSLGTGALVFASAPLVAYVFGEPRAVPILQVLALRPILTGLTNIGVVAFLKEFDFRKEFIFDFLTNVGGGLAMIVLALILHDYWALVLGSLFGAALGAGLSYVLHPYRPRLSLEKVREIWSFSGWLLASYAVEEIATQADRLVVGVIASTKSLGFYHMANTVSQMTLNNTVFALWRGLFPSYAKLAPEPAKLAEAFLQVFAWVAVACSVAGFGVAAVAEDLVLALLGEKWLEAAPLVPWLSLAVAMAAVVDNPLLVLTALGRTRACAIQSMIRLVMMVVALPLAGSFWGALGVAVALFAVILVYLPVPFFVMIRMTPVGIGDIVRHSWRPLVSGGAMFVVATFVADAMEGHPVVALSAEIAAGGLTYVGLSFLLWGLSGRPDGPEATIVQQIRKRLRAHRAA